MTRVGGGNELEKVDVRLITATNRNLRARVKEGKFREDLLYRIEGMPIYIPPLRERKGDIPLLVAKFLGDFAPTTKSVMIVPAALEVLMDYNWPGNVRELRSVVQYAIVQSKFRDIEVCDLPPKISSPLAKSSSEELDNIDGIDLNFDRVVKQTEKTLFERALRHADGSRKKAIELMGLTSSRYFRKIKELEIDG